jgi:hypothetical protein
MGRKGSKVPFSEPNSAVRGKGNSGNTTTAAGASGIGS